MSDFEQTLYSLPKVFAFQVPKLESSDGHKAASWSKTPIWTGRLRVVSKGPKLSILLEHTDKDGLFAACPYENAQTVEPTVDSSRYFVLRISDGRGRHALLGIGFNDRGQAFDFKVSIQEFENRDKIKDELDDSKPKVDFSLAAGQKIHIAVGGKAEAKKAEQKSDMSSVTSGFGGLALAPPDKEKKKKKKKEKESAGFDEFPDFSGSAAASASSASASSSSAGFGASSDVPDDWVKF